MIKLKDILKEVGERSSAPYTQSNLKPSHSEGNIYDSENGGELIYKFNTGEDKDQEGNSVEYTLVLTGNLDDDSGEYFVDVDFFTEEGYGLTNVGKPLRLMATIAQIVEDLVKKDKEKVIDGIIYGPAEKSDEDSDIEYDDKKRTSKKPVNQRDRLYRVYINKALEKSGRSAQFYERDGDIIAKFKKKSPQSKTSKED